MFCECFLFTNCFFVEISIRFIRYQSLFLKFRMDSIWSVFTTFYLVTKIHRKKNQLNIVSYRQRIDFFRNKKNEERVEIFLLNIVQYFPANSSQSEKDLLQEIPTILGCKSFMILSKSVEMCEYLFTLIFWLNIIVSQICKIWRNQWRIFNMNWTSKVKKLKAKNHMRRKIRPKIPGQKVKKRIRVQDLLTMNWHRI